MEILAIYLRTMDTFSNDDSFLSRRAKCLDAGTTALLFASGNDYRLVRAAGCPLGNGLLRHTCPAPRPRRPSHLVAISLSRPPSSITAQMWTASTATRASLVNQSRKS